MSPETCFQEIDSERLLRARTLLSASTIAFQVTDYDPYDIASKSIVVLSYAQWEGFYNTCVDRYLDFLAGTGRKVSDADWSLLSGVFESEFERLRARNISRSARAEFVDGISERLNADFSEFDRKCVKSRSNLDFSRLSENFSRLSIDIGKFLRFRIQIDKQLVGWRHAVAHGDDPDLSALDIRAHVKFTNSLMIELADTFQEKVLEKL